MEPLKEQEMLLLHRMLRPETYPAEAAERCPDLLEAWLKHAPQSLPETRDFEDWAENAAMLAALSKRGEVTLVPHHERYFMSGDRTPATPSQPGAPDAIMWGMFYPKDAIAFPIKANLLWNHHAATSVVQDYALSPVFRSYARRAFHVCDMDKSSIDAALKALHESGIRQAFVKSRAKGFAHRFEMPENGENLWGAMDPEQDIAWMTVSNEGQKNAIYLQEAFKPTREYRTIIVGSAPVTGAGCIEAYTPVNSHGNVFDDRMEYRRNDGRIYVDGAAAAAYEAFARQYARDWAAEHGDHMAYSLDLSIDADSGDIIPIEMNPMLNLGLYANRPELIIDAMLQTSPACVS